MALSAGDKLGPCEILTPIGAGGMGEVARTSLTWLGGIYNTSSGGRLPILLWLLRGSGTLFRVCDEPGETRVAVEGFEV